MWATFSPSSYVMNIKWHISQAYASNRFWAFKLIAHFCHTLFPWGKLHPKMWRAANLNIIIFLNNMSTATRENVLFQTPHWFLSILIFSASTSINPERYQIFLSGGFQWPTISDIRDNYNDNFRFPTLWKGYSVSFTVFVSESAEICTIFPFSATKIGQFPTFAIFGTPL